VAVETPPAFTQGGSFSAEVLRRSIGTLLQRGASIGSAVGGLVGPGDMQVTAGSGMQVLVAPGEAWIPGTSVSSQSAYYGRVTSSTALAISASNGSNPRIETLIAQVKDKAYAGTEENFSVSVIVGTAESGATLVNKKGAGAVPASSLVLAYVLIPASSSSVTNGNIENVAPPVVVRPAWVVGRTGSFTAQAGEVIEMAGSGTVTCPATPPTGAIIEIFAGSSATVKIVAAGAYKFYGDFTNGATEVTLAPLQHVMLRFDGTGVCEIWAGEPKREALYTTKVYSKAEAEAGVEPSAFRPAFVVFEGSTAAALFIGGVQVTSGAVAGSWLVPPGQKWKTTVSVNVATYPL
jgi:hypothetical protein